MNLADLVDLEWLLRDGAPLDDGLVAAARPAALRAGAERGLDPASARGRLDADRALRGELAGTVLAAARARGLELPGRRLARVVEVVGQMLVILGLAVGVATALAVLAYDGTTPVNVLHFAFVFCVLQILLLVLLVAFLLRSRRPAAPGGASTSGIGLLHRPVAWLVDRLLGARGRAAAELLRALRARASLYADLERWTLFGLAQRFGVAFNVAALAVTLLLVTGTDLVFSWSTTLEVPGSAVHRIVTWLALPWRFVWPDGVPSLATVEASQWMRMPRAFVGSRPLAEAQPLAAQWWRFLVAGLVTYGLVPRLAALCYGSWKKRLALRAVGLDHAGFHALFARLLPPAASWDAPDPAGVRGAAPRAGAGPATPHAPHEPGALAMLLCWGSLAKRADAVRAAVAQRFQVGIDAVAAVGGAALDADAKALSQLAARRPQRVVVAVAAGQQPTADVLAFVREARKALGTARPLIVVLAEARADGSLRDAEAQEHAIWRRSLGALSDPHLWVEALAESP